jgi:hypothetical protein
MTESFTSQQKQFVDNALADLVAAAMLKMRVDGSGSDTALEVANYLCVRINAWAPLITKLDQRPKQVWSEEQPDVFFRYVAQAMLEDIIESFEAIENVIKQEGMNHLVAIEDIVQQDGMNHLIAELRKRV